VAIGPPAVGGRRDRLRYPASVPGSPDEPAVAAPVGDLERATPTVPAPGPRAAPSEPRRSLASALLRTARPKQWIKNVLVFAAPAAASVLDEPDQFGRTLIAFVAFCLAASGTYFVNDALDAAVDRLHPTKSARPIAAGELSERTAKIVGAVLVAAALAVAAPVHDGDLLLVIAGYLAITLSYSAWLKHEPVIDLAAVAAGFVIRAIAGGVATGVEISDWFLIVAGGASLFMVTGKRYAEQIELGDASGAHRATLTAYSRQYLAYVRGVASSVTVTAYCLWAFENAAASGETLWFRISVVPFVLGIMRYAYQIEQGQGGAPEELVLSDRVLELLGLAWAVTFAIGVYA
jgi:decaprenyl-phosphate phosphoribosyltransferase